MSHETLGLPVAGGRLPLVGHLTRLYGNQRRFVEELVEQGPLCWFDMGGGDWTLLYGRPDAFELMAHPDLSSRHVGPSSGPIVGDAVIGLDGADHRRARNAMTRSFSPGGLSTSEVGRLTASIIETRVSAMLSRRRFCLLDEMRGLTLEIIFRILGVRPRDLRAWAKSYRALLGGFVQIAGGLPGSPLWRARRARRWLDRRFRELIRDNDAEARLLLSLVDSARDGGMSPGELDDNLRLLALAGHETSASVMTWAALYVLHDPELRSRIAAEVHEAGGPPMAPGDLARHPVAEGVFREALRLHPPISFTQRTVETPIELAGRVLPAGVKVTLSLEWLSRHPDHIERPDTFDPDRWVALGRPVRPSEAVQFGGGPHFCLGYHLAWLEIVQLLAFLATTEPRGSRFTLHWPDPVYFPLLHPRRRATWVQHA